ncbi:MAG: NfeD family protein [Candidatus Omnitrophota bacterium]|nr:NfeD family protein [Candidatus Omnitrophota bacterium]
MPLNVLVENLKDPNIVYILFIIGFYGIIFELATPGTSIGGIIGGISLILAIYGMSSLPVNYAGIILMIVAFVLFVLDLKMPTHGILTFGGIVALTIGSLVLFKGGETFLRLSKALVATTVITTTGLLAFILPMIIKSQKRKASSGVESLVNTTGEAKTDLTPKGIVHVSGEDWYAESLEGAIKSGEKVKVETVDGLVVKVRKER